MDYPNLLKLLLLGLYNCSLLTQSTLLFGETSPLTFKRAEERPLFLHVVFNILSSWIQHLYCWIQLDKMLDIARGKSGHSSALLNVILTFQFLECSLPRNIQR